MSASTEPTAAQLIHFLSVFETLSAFEAQQRYVRGIGAFEPDEAMPDPDVIAVLAWLRRRTGEHTGGPS